MSLKIGIVCSDLPEAGKKPGGVSIVVHELANALVRAKNYVRIYSHTHKPQNANYEVVKIPQISKSKTFARRLILPFQINSLDFADLDLLHLHGDDWAFIRRLLPTIRTFHGCSLNEAKYTRVFRRKLMYLAYHPLELWAKKLADKSVGVGDDTIDILGAEGVIPNGYDPSFFYPETKSAQPTAVVIGTLGGRKQSQKAIKLLLSVKKQIPSLVIHAVVDRPYEDSEVNSWVGISKEQLAKLVRESWIGVSTTLYEGFGVYYLEWMGAETIPISFNNIGVKSIITKHKAGIIANTISEIEKAALLILQNEAIRSKFKQNCSMATASFNWDKIADQYIRLYWQAIKKFNS
ncbi:MAG: hypothetical protein Tsb0014_00250 [Pleurocapsa sp.]